MIVKEISAAGTSIWLDDLSRAKLTDTGPHGLPYRITHDGVVGVTTNPSIFNAAISQGAEYAGTIVEMRDKSAAEIVTVLTTDDVRSACDLFTNVFTISNGIDGRVSIEVDPRSARNSESTISEGKALWKLVDRPNLMIKVPATLECLPAITELISRGISVNVTLIFSVERYVQVFDAFMQGLENRLALGEEISDVTSVASFFVSRIDTAIDALLKKSESTYAKELLGKAAIANAILAYEAFEEIAQTERWRNLQRKGARIQRPLWASTGVKDPAYEDTRYVLDLIAANTVNTMPQATLDAVIDHGSFKGDTITSHFATAHSIFARLGEIGVSVKEVTDFLEIDGVAKFSAAWMDLLQNVEKARTA
ncbi:MAG: transaldolase [Actinobacteria bacterium]|nr:transaldolase [Actinomycetota bacterium]